MKQRVATMFGVIILLVVGTLTVGGTTYSDRKEKIGKAEMAAAAKVTIEQSIKTTSEKASGKIIKAELEKEHNKLVWEVEVVTVENKTMQMSSSRLV
ncbi:MAG: hypothetical protein JSS38_02660 [Nitrospira sp.]|nr:hypothetical protein [Nitrospira sp.]MBS0153471.1 hypothetical protein [Nitrospira sp.]MBS0165090.1 hypothetical protein [Nitrospira sp.]